MDVDWIREEISASISVKQQVLADEFLLKQVVALADSCVAALRAGGKIIFCGNGGSFADAQHLSAEFTSRFMFDRASLASIALGTNSSTLTALGNDYGYENVFSREIESIASEKDIFVAISTSGNSDNVIKAVKTALAKEVKTFVFTGGAGGNLRGMAECLLIPSSNTARIQECHILIGHILCGIVESTMFAKADA
jgi:D-sedoheptulose 7-phosphate isomerase